jgi:uncharacterized paraquat-inducible protein A
MAESAITIFDHPKHRWVFTVRGATITLFLRTADQAEAHKIACTFYGDMGITADEIETVSFDSIPCTQFPPHLCQHCGTALNDAEEGLCPECHANSTQEEPND